MLLRCETVSCSLKIFNAVRSKWTSFPRLIVIYEYLHEAVQNPHFGSVTSSFDSTNFFEAWASWTSCQCGSAPDAWRWPCWCWAWTTAARAQCSTRCGRPTGAWRTSPPPSEPRRTPSQVSSVQNKFTSYNNISTTYHKFVQFFLHREKIQDSTKEQTVIAISLLT